MGSRCIVLIHGGSHINPGALCDKTLDRLPELLSNTCIGSLIRTDDLLDIPRLSPALILLRVSDLETLLVMLQSLQLQGVHAPILGLFCASMHTPDMIEKAIDAGLSDFVCCPFQDVDLVPRILRFVDRHEPSPESLQNPMIQELRQRVGLLGESAPFLHMIEQALKVASVDATLLITGETGTGKELVARAVHYRSQRLHHPFVPVNCGALPNQLIENELFGHAKGAYTDATAVEKGLIAEAEGGTLFLDEIDALSLSAQVKLLRFLQEREYRLVGSAKTQTANVRIIAATNTDLWQQVQAERFREDLFYRLDIVVLRMPPLRERLDDLPLLALHFLRRYAAQYGQQPQQLSGAALRHLMAYAWPGNIRELESVMQRAVLFATSPTLEPHDFEFHHGTEPMPFQAKIVPFREAKAQVITDFERTYLSHLLATHKGNISRAAQQAGKERRAFTRLLEKHNLHSHAFSH